MSRLDRFHAGRVASWVVLAAVVGLGAGPPEVVRVRVPSSKVSAWFPAGTNLQVVPPDQFEELVRSALARKPEARGPRLLRARHSARWESGMLVGRSELVVERPAVDGPSLLVLEPWSPAIPPTGSGASLVRSTEDGRLGIRLAPDGPSSVAIDWQLRARPGSDGRLFSVSLPEVEPSDLTIGLPIGLAPEGRPGAWIGPETGPSEGYSSWTLPTPGGRFSLRLRDRSEERLSAGSPRLWLEGPTRIDLNASPANWRAEWTIDESPGAPRGLTIELDPGLELIDVEGSRVASFRVEPGSSPSRVAIRLEGDGRAPSPLTIRAIAQVPAEGPWPVPSARPVDAIWTGGRTTIRLNPGRVLEAALEKSGRRVAPGSGEASTAQTLAFESGGGVGPLAELTFRKPSTEASVLIRGHFRVLEDAPRIEVALTWTAEKGRLPTHEVDLPPGWTPDRVVSGLGESVPWHSNALPGGGSRVRMSPSAIDAEARGLTMTLAASLRGAGAFGPVELPRVRPSSASGRVVDEVWVATTSPGLALRPTLARGLAWVDPPDPARDASTPPWADADLAGALAWRWLTDDAEARADRVRSPSLPKADVRLDASIARGRLQLDWTLALDGLDPKAAYVPIHLSTPPGAPVSWKVDGPGGGPIEARAIDEPRRASMGLPPGGESIGLELPRPGSGRLTLKAHAELDWAGKGRLPLLTLPEPFRTRGLVSVRVEDTVRLRIEPEGLTPVDLSEAAREVQESADDPAREGEPGHRRVLLFRYDEPTGHLGIETTPGEPGPTGGVVLEAWLTTQVHPATGLRNRLTLRVAADNARDLVLTLPESALVDRLRRDGQPVLVSSEGRSLRIALPPAARTRGPTRITIDYRTGPPSASSLSPSAILPVCPLPCLSFVWEVVKPDPWEVRGPTPGLVDSDPAPDRSWTRTLLGFRSDPREFLPLGPIRGDREAGLDDLDTIGAGPSEGNPSLGDWLVRLDSGRRPLVIDRLALLSAGLGPATRVSLDPGASRATGLVDETLRTLGLVATPIHGVILITTKVDGPGPERAAPSSAEAWAVPLLEAGSRGSDGSDRFQSASRWRGEATPRALVAGETPDRLPGTRGWTTRRFVGREWPSSTDSVELIDARAEAARGWLVASIVLTAGILVRRKPPRARALAIGAALVASGFAIAWGWPEPASWVSGSFRGLLAVLAFWVGRSIRGVDAGPAESSAGGESASRSRLGSRVATVSAVLAMSGLGSISTGAGPDPGLPVLALFPFDGPPNPSSKPNRVVIRLDDFERLRHLAQPETPPSTGRVTVLASTYRVSRDVPGFATVEGRFDLEVEGAGPVSWSVPAGQARDLSATVDARPTSLVFLKEGRVATLSVAGPGVHSVRVRGTIPLVAAGPVGERFRLPILRSAFARVEVAPDSRGHWVDVPEAIGRVEVQPSGIEGTIGPLDALEVRWFATDRPRPVGPRGPVESTVLWDARPVGDLVRVRLVHSDPEGASALRLATEPGLLVRGYSIPDLVGFRLEGTAERPEWVAHVDPPWPRDTPIEVDFWRPGVPGSGVRRLPRIETVDARRLTGVIGFRRPGDWSGRLEAGPGPDPLPESGFVKAWGTLPVDGLTLAGAVRLGSSTDFSVVVGPLPTRRMVRPRVGVEIEPGRLKVAIDATLSDRQGRSFEVEVGIPPEFRLARVEAAGMVDWRRVAPDRLRIQLDGSEVVDRPIQVLGYLPVPADPVLVEVRGYRARLPWPRWPDASTEAGTLAVSGPIRFQVEASEGVSPIPTAAAAEPGPGFRAAYRVENPEGLGAIAWSSPRSKVGVSVRSDLTIDDRQVTWTAVVDSEVTGGPAESLLWNLPTDWAKAAALEIDGRPIRPSIETKGEITAWKIQPDPPIWKQARLVIRSTIPLRPGVAFSFPEISPMAVAGRGSVSRYDLAIANVSGRPMEVAGTAGLQPMDVSQYRSDESPAPPGSIGRAYRVTGERWGLRITVVGDPVPAGGLPPGTSRVARARLRGSLDERGRAVGQATYDLGPRPGPYLALRLSPGDDLPWASVDGMTAPVIRDGPGRWLVVLRDRNARRVEVAWVSGPPGRGTGSGSGSVGWPTTDQPDVPTSLRWSGPTSIGITALPGGLKPVTAREWDLEDAEQLARRVAEALADFHRGSRRYRAEVLRDVVAFELKERAIRRTREAARGPSESDEARLQAAGAGIAEAAQLSGMDDLIQEARALVGREAPASDQTLEDRADPAEPIRIRPVGESRHFRGGGTGSPTITWARKPAGPAWRTWLVGSVGLMLAAVSALVVARPIRGLRGPGLVAALGLGLVLLAVEPLGTGLAVAIGGLGKSWD